MTKTNAATVKKDMPQNLGYFQAVFSVKTKTRFSKLVEKLFTKSELYKSQTVDYIKGNVADDLHLTLFYGIKTGEANLDEVKEYLHTLKLSKIELGDINFFDGYKNQYKVAYITVLDRDKSLEGLAMSFKRFPFEKSVQYPVYKPHITLAYLNFDFDVKRFRKTVTRLVKLPKRLDVYKIEFMPD